MTTVKQLIDKVYRTYLEPPDTQVAATRLVLGMDVATENISLNTFEVPEDSNLLRIGSVIEVGSELMRVKSWDDANMVGVVERGVDSTVATAHVLDDRVKLSPPFSRHSVFEDTRDAIIALYPRLWTIKTHVLVPLSANVYGIPDPLVVEAVEINPENSSMELSGRVVDYHELANGRALVVNGGMYGTIWVRFRRRFDVATSEDDVLEDLGLEPTWEGIVTSLVAAGQLAGKDIPRSHVEWVSKALEAEVAPVGTQGQLSTMLIRYHEYLLGRAAKEMVAEDSSDIRVQMQDPFAQVR